MSFDFESRDKKTEAAAVKRLVEQMHSDAKSVLETTAGRRLVWAFIQSTGIDASPFSTNAMAQTRTVGLQDGARWWLELIRDACPEREAQMRADSIRAAKERRNNREAPTDD